MESKVSGLGAGVKVHAVHSLPAGHGVEHSGGYILGISEK